MGINYSPLIKQIATHLHESRSFQLRVHDGPHSGEWVHSWQLGPNRSYGSGDYRTRENNFSSYRLHWAKFWDPDIERIEGQIEENDDFIFVPYAAWMKAGS